MIRTNVYLFKTSGEPCEIKIRNRQTGSYILIYLINPNVLEYTDGLNTIGKRFDNLFVDRSLQKMDWLWRYYVPALANRLGRLHII